MSIQSSKKSVKSVIRYMENNKKSIFLGLTLAAFCFQSEAFCADNFREIDSVTNNVMNTIFSPWVKKAALVFGAGSGLFQAWASGSFKPFLLWGGLGLAVNYIPKIIDLIANIS
jgi:hypothetical protein